MTIYLEKRLRFNSQELQLKNKNPNQYSLGFKENRIWWTNLLILSTSPFGQVPYPIANREVGGEASYLQEEEEVSNFSQCQFLQQRVELLSPQDYPSSDKKVVKCREHGEYSASRSLSVFPEKLGKVKKQPPHFRVSKGISDSISIRTISNGTSQLKFNESGGNCHSVPGNLENAEEGCNKISPTQHKKIGF